MSKLPSYKAVKNVFEHLDALVSPAESHGLLCGIICSGKSTELDAASWAVSALAGSKKDQAIDAAEASVLEDLFEVTFKKIEGMELDFALLLPPDEEEMSVRAKELGHWCHGFVSGLSLGGFTASKLQSEDSKEALARFQEISEIEYDHIDIDEEDEVAYFEVSEYVRMAVLMIFCDIKGGVTSSDPQTNKHLH